MTVSYFRANCTRISVVFVTGDDYDNQFCISVKAVLFDEYAEMHHYAELSILWKTVFPKDLKQMDSCDSCAVCYNFVQRTNDETSNFNGLCKI